MSYTRLASLLALITALSLAISPALLARSSTEDTPDHWNWQERPALGWNSWDCYGAGVNEEQTLANAEYVQEHLKPHGYDLITVDIQWYEPLAHTGMYRRGAELEMDAHGRLLPAANRFPMTAQTRSFKPLADRLHAMGLRLGVHLMRGIPRQAVDRDNVVILGTEALKEGGIRAADIADKRNVCAWNGDMYGVDMTKPGAQEYYDSVFALLASWEVDFVKVDDLSAPRYQEAEVEAIRKAIDKTGRPMALSTSPGATPLSAGPSVQMNANQWRVSNDFWDRWDALQSQFKRLADWTPYRGPGHFPDADMLPVGRLEMWINEDTPTPGRETRFTQDELYTLMNLWCIARSPLIIGADLPSSDAFTLQLLTNDELLKVNQYSTNNREFSHEGNAYIWIADAEDSDSKYVAMFNAPAEPRRGRGRGRRGAPAETEPTPAPGPLTISLAMADLNLDPALKVTNVRNLWAHEDQGALQELSVTLAPHASAIFEIQVGNK